MTNHMPLFADRLRSETRGLHRQLDQHPLLRPLIQSDVDTDRYGRALQALHGPQLALEGLLTDFLTHHQQADRFPLRSPALESDLSILGRSPLPLRVAMPELLTEADRVGVMYVLEGSQLGGAYIARQLDKHLPATAPRQFFDCPQGGIRWEHFWCFVADLALTEPQQQQAIEAACVCLRLYLQHLESCQQ